MNKNKDKRITGVAIAMCVLGALFYYYEYFLRVAPAVMRIELMQVFSIGEEQFGILAAYYYYAYTPLQIPVGILMDRFGPRRILTLACFLCAFGTYLFVTTYLPIAQLGRFLVGFGSAFAYVGILKLSNVWLPKKYFAMMAGISTALGMFGGISGTVVMSYGVDTLGWQSTLYYSMLAGFALTLILWLVIRDRVSEYKTDSISIEPNFKIKFESLKGIISSSQMWLCGIIGCLTFFPITGFAEVWAVSFLQTVGMSKNEAAVGASMLFLGFAITHRKN